MPDRGIQSSTDRRIDHRVVTPMNPDDTIVAISSASGPAARMIVRTSGPAAVSAAGDVAPRASTALASATLASLHFAGLTCPGWVYVFRGPRSYTGDDLVEYHIPGNPILAKLLVEHLRVGGLRPAEPGEFTARAYFNGRIDLTEAEGVVATIAAGSEQELAAARGLLAGELSRRLAGPADAVADALALLEVGIDFSDEDVTFLPTGELRSRAAAAAAELRALVTDSPRFERLSHEPTFVLIGRPNAGKSTLLNALAGYERAVASPVAGTTRDALAATVVLPRGQVRVIDVAGLEAAAAASEDRAEQQTDRPSPPGRNDPADEPVESIRRQMRDRALWAVTEADFVVGVRPFDADPNAGDPWARQPDLVVTSKADVSRHRPPVATSASPNSPTATKCLAPADLPVSALTGSGMKELRVALDGLAFGRAGSEAKLALNARHVAAVGEAAAALERAAALAGGPAELVAIELRAALDAIGTVRGQVSPDELLGRIFGRFCIGK